MRRTIPLVVLALSGACASPPPKVAAPPEAAVAEIAPPPPIEDHSSLEESLAHLIAPGTEVHAGPIALPYDQWVAWIGTHGTTRQRVVGRRRGADAQIVSTTPMPVGARVVRTLPAGERVVAVLESLAVWDQPAGLRGFDVAPPFPEPLLPMEVHALASASDDDIGRTLIARHAPPKLSDEDQRQFLTDVQKPERAMSRNGTVLLQLWQDAFVRELGHVTTLTEKTPTAVRMKDVLDYFSSEGCLTPGICCGETGCARVIDASPDAVLGFARENGKLAVASVIATRSPAPFNEPRTPRAVPTSSTTTLTDEASDWLDQHGDVLGEATLGDQTLGLLLTKIEGQEPSLFGIDRRGGSARLITYQTWAADLSHLETSFGDFDGDGVLDVLVRAPMSPMIGLPPHAPVAFPFLTPRAMGPITVLADPPLQILLANAPSISDAARIALSTETFAPTAKERCQLARWLKSKSSFDAALVKHGGLFHYFEPSSFGFTSSPTTSKGIGSATTAYTCESLQCDPERPFCALYNGPATDYFVLGHGPRGLSLLSAAFYSGS